MADAGGNPEASELANGTPKPKMKEIIIAGEVVRIPDKGGLVGSEGLTDAQLRRKVLGIPEPKQNTNT